MTKNFAAPSVRHIFIMYNVKLMINGALPYGEAPYTMALQLI
jgi:hypothetical protein